MGARGNMTYPPTYITYLYVASSDYVIITSVIAALNGLGILTADIENSYLNATCS